MKKLFVTLTLIICGAAIVLGNLHWNQKISAQGESVVKTKQISSVQEQQKKEEKGFDKYSSNLPKSIQEKINNAAITKEPLELVIFGTTAVESAWPDQFSKELIDKYGEDLFHVTVLSTGDKTTRDVLNDKLYEEINELHPDILLFEPSMLKDNGIIGIENTLDNIQSMINSWKEANEEIALMIQPPNPLYSATYYPKEVSQLNEYAEENNITYLNHWENWPGLEDEKMKEYLTKENKANENGHKVWAEYLINYFIAK